MPKSKLKTPEWILNGYDSEADYKKAKGIRNNKKEGRTFKIKVCPKCKSDNVKVVISGSDSEEKGGGEWECKKCKWRGRDAEEKEFTEEKFMEYLDEKGEDVA